MMVKERNKRASVAKPRPRGPITLNQRRKREAIRLNNLRIRIVSNLRDWFALANEREITEMIWQVCDAIDHGIRKQLKGQRSPLILARLRGICAREALKKDEGGSISLRQAIAHLKISRSDLLNRYRQRLLIGWRDEGRVRFPIWQFSKSGMLPGIERVLQALRETPWNDDWGLMLFFLSNRESCSGQRLLDLVREGRIDQAMKYVHAYD